MHVSILSGLLLTCLSWAPAFLHAGCGGGGAPVAPNWTTASAAEKQAAQGVGRVYCLESATSRIQIWDAALKAHSQRIPFIRVEGAEAERMAKEAGVALPAVVLTDSYGNLLSAQGGNLKAARINDAVKVLPEAIIAARKQVAEQLTAAKAALEKQPAKAKEQFTRLAALKGYVEADEARAALASTR